MQRHIFGSGVGASPGGCEQCTVASSAAAAAQVRRSTASRTPCRPVPDTTLLPPQSSLPYPPPLMPPLPLST